MVDLSKLPGALDDYQATYTAIAQALTLDWRLKMVEADCARLSRPSGLQLFLSHDRHKKRIVIGGEFYVKDPDQESPVCLLVDQENYGITCADSKTPAQIAKAIESRLLFKYRERYQKELQAYHTKWRKKQNSVEVFRDLAAIVIPEELARIAGGNNPSTNLSCSVGSVGLRLTVFSEHEAAIEFTNLDKEQAAELLNWIVAKMKKETAS